MPGVASFCLMSGWLKTCLMSAAILPTTFAGVPAGTKTPCQFSI
jgi:hypothetical protein